MLEFLSLHKFKTQVTRFGLFDRFVEHGDSVNQLRKLYGLTEQQIVSNISESLMVNDQLSTNRQLIDLA